MYVRICLYMRAWLGQNVMIHVFINLNFANNLPHLELCTISSYSHPTAIDHRRIYWKLKPFSAQWLFYSIKHYSATPSESGTSWIPIWMAGLDLNIRFSTQWEDSAQSGMVGMSDLVNLSFPFWRTCGRPLSFTGLWKLIRLVGLYTIGHQAYCPRFSADWEWAGREVASSVILCSTHLSAPKQTCLLFDPPVQPQGCLSRHPEKKSSILKTEPNDYSSILISPRQCCQTRGLPADFKWPARAG